MGGNDHYVKERPNPYGLTHTQIFERLSGHGDAAAGGSPTEPLRRKADELLGSLDQLARMVAALNYSYQAESTQRGVTAIKTVSAHVESLGEHAGQLAEAFDNYIAAVHTARARLPEPVPLADAIDAVQEKSPGLLAQIPILAQIEEEHDARTREAQEVYRQLDQIAVRVDDATPEFDRMHAPTTTTQAGVVTVNSDTPATNRTHASPVPAVSNWTPAAGYSPNTTAPAALPLAPVAPTQTPGAGPAPIPGSPRLPGATGAAGDPPVATAPRAPLATGRPGGPDRPGGQPGRPPGRPGGSHLPDPDAGRAARPGFGDGRGMGSDAGGRAGGLGAGHGQDGAASRTSGAIGRAPAGSGGGFGPVGPGGWRREEDHEHRRPSYLEESDDPHTLFGSSERVAPPVIGAEPPRASR